MAAGALPEGAAHVWQWFRDLSNKRQVGMGPNPIAEEAVGWYFRNRGLAPMGWELQAISLLDIAWLNAQAERQNSKQAN